VKKGLIVAAVIVAIVAAVGFFLWNRLDIIVKVALEHYGPDVMGVSVKVADVEISPHDGRGRLRNLEIGNPPGFTASRSARFGDVILEVDPATLRQPIVHVRAIGVDAPTIVYERGDKTTNLDVISKNIEAYSKRSGDSDGTSRVQGTKRRFVIDRLLIRGAKVTMTTPSLKGQGVSFDLPDIELRDIGKRQDGLTASQVAAVVTNTLIVRISQRVLSNIDLLRKGGIEGAIDALKGLIH
jgi:uncharacterized protein involved in outer membrane biogenesis